MARVSGQTILNGDGSPFKTNYCWYNTDYRIIGQPSGGQFSGCGVFQQNGEWYFNPVLASQSSSVFPYSCAVSYTVNGFTANEEVVVEKPVIPDVPFKDSATCTGDIFLHVHMKYAGDYTYLWTPSAFVKNPTAPNTSGHINQTQTFVLTTTDLSNGCIGKDSLTIVRSYGPVLQVSNDTAVAPLAQVQLRASGAQVYIWSPTQWLSNPFIANPVALPHDAITYVLTGLDEYGCAATVQVHISVYDGLYLPDAFTPNGDGLNDVFRIINFGYEGLQEFRIFNRWGQQVFTTNDGLKGWDGTINGHPADAGTYYYIIRIGMLDGSQKNLKGNVELIR